MMLEQAPAATPRHMPRSRPTCSGRRVSTSKRPAAADRMRTEGRLRPLAQVLMLRSVARFLLGHWRAALADATDIFGAVTDKYGIGWQVNIGAAGT